jgi:hypothetical protein
LDGGGYTASNKQETTHAGIVQTPPRPPGQDEVQELIGIMTASSDARSLEKHGIPRQFTTKSCVIIICND